MKLKTRKIHKVLLLQLLIAAMLLPMQVFAAETKAEYKCSVTIPAEVQVTGSSVPSGNEYTVVLETVEEEPDNPVPEKKELTVIDAGTVQFGPIEYTRPEDYHYTIYQKGGNAANFTYDETVFHVTVRVVNDEESGGLKWEMWAVRDDSENKTETIRFENHYSKPSEPEEERTHGGDPGDEPEEEISVVPTVVKKADPVQVVPVVPLPDPGPSQAGGSQTGDSAYPVLWAGLLAMAVFAFAIILVKRKKNENTEE